MRELVGRHTLLPANAVHTRESRNGRYLSVSCTFEAQSRDQLNAIYTDLQADPDVLATL